MFSVALSLNAAEFTQSLRRFAEEFHKAAGRAVISAAREGVSLIVQRTGEPPIPRAKVYQRTNRLISGWASAGNFLNTQGPSARSNAKGRDEGTYSWEPDGSEIRFVAINSVPYALAVELTGTWIIPPPRQQRRAPYLTVANSIKEMESKGSFERHIGNEWDALI